MGRLVTKGQTRNRQTVRDWQAVVTKAAQLPVLIDGLGVQGRLSLVTFLVMNALSGGTNLREVDEVAAPNGSFVWVYGMPTNA